MWIAETFFNWSERSVQNVYPQLFYHLVWGTKFRRPMITEEIEQPLYRYICYKSSEYGYKMIRVNGVEDHIHVLIELPPRISVAEATGKLKGSSLWFVSDLAGCWFGWQRGYGAFTVGKRDLSRVIRYIRRQKEHHRRGTWTEDLEPPDDDA